MIATFINAGLVLLGSIIGLVFKNRISERFSVSVSLALGLCVLGIGISNLLQGEDTLCLIICMVLGTLLGELLNIEGRLDSAGELLRRKVSRKDSPNRFTEGFVTASLMYCIGAMSVAGSLEAGLNHNYSIIISKGVIDGVTAITFSAAMGVGVVFSVLPILVYQGALTLLAGVAGPYLSDAVIAGMTSTGGAIIVGLAINMLGLGKAKIKVGNMLPAIFLPIAYIPFSAWLGGLLSQAGGLFG